MEFDIVSLGKRIRTLRISRHMPQQQLAIALYISSKHLSNLENGQKGPSIDLLVLIAAYFHVSLDYLILGSSVIPDHLLLSPIERNSAQLHLNELQKLLTFRLTFGA